MKTISQTYKDNIKQLGKEITYEITYGNTTLGDEDILNANLHYDGGMLKSVMKQLDIELYNDLPIGTELTYKFGVKVDDTNYEKINYGKFIVYSSEKQEDSNTYKLVCYDKMLNAMKDYEAFATFPITIRDYINALCNHLNITFANSNDDFTNYDKTIENELYIDNEGNNIGYTYRDVLDELAQATASTICINDNDELEIRYITNANEEKASISGTSFNMTAYDTKADIDLLGNTTQNTTTGKNLLKGIITTKTANNVTITKNDDNSCTIKTNGTASANTFFYTNENTLLKANTTYLIGLGNGNSDVQISVRPPDNSTQYANTTTTPYVTYTPTQDLNVRLYVRVANGKSVNETIYPYIQAGTSTPIYEPYTGGIASPNPNYPQNIETTTGRNTIEVAGKNRLPISSLTSSTLNGITFTNNNHGSYTFNGTATSYTAFNLFTNLSFNGNYTYVLKDTATSGFTMYLQNSNGNGIGSTTTHTTINNNVARMIIGINNRTTLNNLTIKPYVYSGNYDTSISYEPYIGNSYEVNLGKNLLPNNGVAQTTINGMTFTKNNDGSVSMNGTATAIADYYMFGSTTDTGNYIYIPKGTYSISTPSAGWLYIGKEKTLGAVVGNMALINALSSQDCYFYGFFIRANSGATFNNFTLYPQIEKGTQASSYSKYFTPIELCKIGNYQDRLFKASGKNLIPLTNQDFTKNSVRYYVQDGILYLNGTSTGETGSTSTEFKNNFTFTLKAGTYNFSWKYVNGISVSVKNYNSNTNLAQLTQNISNASFTLAEETQVYIGFYVYQATTNNTNIELMLEKGSTKTSYEPYGNDWYLYKETIKIIIPANLQGNLQNNNRRYFVSNTNIGGYDILHTNSIGKTFGLYCDILQEKTAGQTWGGVQGISYDYYAAQNTTGFDFAINGLTTAQEYQTALEGKVIIAILNTPTYTKIENDELIGQLEHIRLINGYNNVISNSPITLNYVSSIDTIDEEYLKDINVNFGEEVKPINTITFKRSGDTDVISLSYPEDLEDDKKNEIAISENQILNYDNRDEYLKGILDRLYGLTYCLNDYTSTGITYYDLCDRYEVSITKTDDEGNTIENNIYPCIMFNDEINVNQGLQEIVHTDRPEESITDYNTTSKTDRLKTRTDLIVNKQEGFIEAVTGSLQIGEDGQSEVVNGVVSRQTTTEATIKVITSFDENGNPTGVKTTKGFTFDEDGLDITSSDNTYKTRIDEEGTYYYDGDKILGQTTKEGSKFKNMDLYGEFRYGMDEVDDNPLFVSMAYKDGIEDCFGHFWNGD